MTSTDETNLAARLVIHCYGCIPPLSFVPTAKDGGIEWLALRLIESDDGKALDGLGGAQAAARTLGWHKER